ncbi:hypothetical protein [Streptomyces sp. CdTB01]|uniref:hypothetical protein n=1 Tax=Streptomyces sp. CdTB01 TaxID=1725411 RepID=UPI00131F3565|nr:hypothetical protein [Streptomyces sp. CdTB01]
MEEEDRRCEGGTSGEDAAGSAPAGQHGQNARAERGQDAQQQMIAVRRPSSG